MKWIRRWFAMFGFLVIRRKEYACLVDKLERRCDYYDWLTASHKRLCENLVFQYDIGNYLRNQLQDLGQKNQVLEDRRRVERKAAFTAGKFHSAGGYAHALKETRAKLASTTTTMIRFMDLCAKWRPLVEALETYPNQFVEIDFDTSLHSPLACIDKHGEHYTRTVRYEDVCKPLVSQSDPFAQADFAAVGAEVAKEREP